MDDAVLETRRLSYLLLHPKMKPGRFKFEKLSKYPHLKPEDVAVWARFLTQHEGFFESVDYDFKVGEGAPQAPTLPENIARDGKILTQKKVDVVGYFADIVYIVELKPIADMRALGQILAYHALYIKFEAVEGDVKKLVIAGEMERELDEVFADNGIEVILV